MVATLGRELLEQLAFLRAQRIEQRRLHSADGDGVGGGPTPSVGEHVVAVVGPCRLGPVLHEPLAVPEERVRLLVDVVAGIERPVPDLLHPTRELVAGTCRPPSR